ncbi:MAG: methyltransferase domain-containing protein [Crocinitomicaceae bacterium]|nr:methyltransferase domain-containing protein [Crocinitomicaceae bacterium]
MDSEKKEWFRTWFDSPYYSLLYQNRDEAEAIKFIGKLIKTLPVRPGASVLDLACGSGRHSVILHDYGFQVTGIDLSPNNIAEAKKNETDGLVFFNEDMRTFALPDRFDLALNLFTSFGYFDNLSDNKKVLERVKIHLKSNALFVIDYFNVSFVMRQMVNCDEKRIGDVLFTIRKKIENDRIVKTIEVSDKKNKFSFEEKVQLFDAESLEKMLADAGFNVVSVYGDYDMNPFDIQSSERLIIIAHCS